MINYSQLIVHSDSYNGVLLLWLWYGCTHYVYIKKFPDDHIKVQDHYVYIVALYIMIIWRAVSWLFHQIL